MAKETCYCDAAITELQSFIYTQWTEIIYFPYSGIPKIGAPGGQRLMFHTVIRHSKAGQRKPILFIMLNIQISFFPFPE